MSSSERLVTNPQLRSIVAMAIIGVCITGYFIGLSAPMKPPSAPAGKSKRSGVEEGSSRLPAMSYAEIARQLRNKRSVVSELSQLRSGANVHSNLLSSVERAQTRAFPGAPPTIPHAIDQLNSASCLVCHGKGVRAKTLRIPMMSHRFLANCTQCHVEQRPNRSNTLLIGNGFRRRTSSTKSRTRAFSGAPPTIPHAVKMRSNCLSCHGHAGPKKLQTKHPDRVNCRQCHVDRAGFNR